METDTDIRGAIREAGGLVILSDMAPKWGVSVERMQQLGRQSTFPEPIGTVGKDDRKVYLRNELDEWRAGQFETGKPVRE